MKKVPSEEDPRNLHRSVAAVTGEENEGEKEEEGNVAEVRQKRMMKRLIKPRLG